MEPPSQTACKLFFCSHSGLGAGSSGGWGCLFWDFLPSGAWRPWFLSPLGVPTGILGFCHSPTTTLILAWGWGGGHVAPSHPLTKLNALNLLFFSFLFFSFPSFLVFLEPHLWHMEVPRLGVQSELQLPAYTTATATWGPSRVCNLQHSSQQRWVLNPLSKAKDRTCILMHAIQIHFH